MFMGHFHCITKQVSYMEGSKRKRCSLPIFFTVKTPLLKNIYKNLVRKHMHVIYSGCTWVVV